MFTTYLNTNIYANTNQFGEIVCLFYSNTDILSGKYGIEYVHFAR